MALGKVCASCGNPRLQWDEKCSKCGGSFAIGIFCWQKWAAYGFLIVKDALLLGLCLHWMLQVRHHFK